MVLIQNRRLGMRPEVRVLEQLGDSIGPVRLLCHLNHGGPCIITAGQEHPSFASVHSVSDRDPAVKVGVGPQDFPDQRVNTVDPSAACGAAKSLCSGYHDELIFRADFNQGGSDVRGPAVKRR